MSNKPLMSTKTVTFKKSRLVIIVALLIAVVGIGTYFLVSYLNRPDGNNQTSGGGLMFDPNTKDYTGSDPEDKGGAAQGIKIPGYGTVYFPSGTTDVQMVLLNPEGNPCYFTFELVVDGDTFYKSDWVAPAKCIEGFSLNKPLKKGEYSAKLQIRTFDLETHDGMNGANVDFRLIVQ